MAFVEITRKPRGAKRGFYKSDNIIERPPTPEEELITAIIDRAIRDAMGGAKAGSSFPPYHIAREAKAWLRSQSVEPWTYHWCRERIGLSEEFHQRLRKIVTAA